MSEFETLLKFGKVAESAIALWMMSRGNSVMPAGEIEKTPFQGPRFLGAQEKRIAPDMMCFNNDVLFVECKRKTGFDRHRVTGTDVTGINLDAYEDYQAIQRSSGKTVWVLFLHEGGRTKNSASSPAGLFGASIEALVRNEHHRHTFPNGKAMVYFAREEDGGPLRLVAEHEEIMPFIKQANRSSQ